VLFLFFEYRIKQVKNLDTLTQLDVLDLNGNQVSFDFDELFYGSFSRFRFVELKTLKV
jgi:hypothetical protein